MRQVETLLTALGRSDNAAAAMQVLGPHAGKVLLGSPSVGVKVSGKNMEATV